MRRYTHHISAEQALARHRPTRRSTRPMGQLRQHPVRPTRRSATEPQQAQQIRPTHRFTRRRPTLASCWAPQVRPTPQHRRPTLAPCSVPQVRLTDRPRLPTPLMVQVEARVPHYRHYTRRYMAVAMDRAQAAKRAKDRLRLLPATRLAASVERHE